MASSPRPHEMYGLSERTVAYNVGLFRTFGHPEIVVFGLDPDLMQELINLIGEEIGQGRRYADGGVASSIIEGFDLRFLVAARRHY